MSAQVDTVKRVYELFNQLPGDEQSRRAHPALAELLELFDPGIDSLPPRGAAGRQLERARRPRRAGRRLGRLVLGVGGAALSFARDRERSKRVLALTDDRFRGRDGIEIEMGRRCDLHIPGADDRADPDLLRRGLRPGRVRRHVAFPAHANPRAFFEPRRSTRPRSGEIPFPPSRMIHFFDASNEKMAAKVRTWPAGRHPAGNLEDAIPADRRRRARGPDPRRQGGRLRRHAAVDPREQPRKPMGAGRPDAARDEIGDKLSVIMVPKVEGPGTSTTWTGCWPSWRQRPASRAAARARAPGDRAGRRELRGDRDRQPAHAGDELRPADLAASRRRRPPRGRRPPRLPGDRGP